MCVYNRGCHVDGSRHGPGAVMSKVKFHEFYESPSPPKKEISRDAMLPLRHMSDTIVARLRCAILKSELEARIPPHSHSYI